jgi:hypothetical protein
MGNTVSRKCLAIFMACLLIILGLVAFTHYKLSQANKKIAEIEYKDSVNNYNKIYYETSIKELKKRNRQLYDSLEASRDRIDYLVQFTAKQQYSTGKVIIKEKHDTVYKDSIKEPKTFEYTNVNPNDTMNYKLKINSSEEPNWYSLDIKTSTKYTIVNKELENGQNHITIGDEGHNADISDVTVFKKKKKTFWDRFTVGPSVTAGYDVCNKQWGIMAGGSITFDLTK